MSALQHHLDLATWIAEQPSAIQLSGWCVWNDGQPVRNLVARVGHHTTVPAEIVERPDVAAHLGKPSALLSGFCFRLPFVELEELIQLEARDEGGRVFILASMRAGDLPNRSAVITDYAALRNRGWGAPPTTRPSISSTLVDVDPAAPNAPPLFSVVVPVFNSPPRLLRECIDSVLNQTFANWELWAVDDGSAEEAPRQILRERAASDPRIHFAALATRQGISRATNCAIEKARGEFVVFLDHDDRLLSHALATLATAVAQPSASVATVPDVLYTDEEKITEAGAPVWPILKPAFSPELFRGVMYVGHLLCVRRSLVVEVGGFDSQFDGVQDYELLLRITERSPHIVHIPLILYQWRMSPASTAAQGNNKGGLDTKQLNAVQAHLQRTGRQARARSLGRHRVRIEPPDGFARPQVFVCATRAAAESVPLRKLAGSELCILDEADFATPDFRGIEARAHEWWNARSRSFDGVLPPLVLAVSEPLLDVSSSWLDHLTFLALEPDSRRVSPIVHSIERKVLEAGCTITADGKLVGLMRGFDPMADGYHGSLQSHREVFAASPICWVARLDDGRSRTQFDRVCASAWVRVARSWSSVEHADEASASTSPVTAADPFFNPAFSRRHADYRLADRPSPAFTSATQAASFSRR